MKIALRMVLFTVLLSSVGAYATQSFVAPAPGPIPTWTPTGQTASQLR